MSGATTSAPAPAARGPEPRVPRRPSPRRLTALGAFSAIVYAFVLAPIAVVLVSSFTAADYTSFPPRGLSLRWYLEIPRNPEFVESFKISVAALPG